MPLADELHGLRVPELRRRVVEGGADHNTVWGQLKKRVFITNVEGSKNIVADSTWLALKRIVKDGGGPRSLFAGIVPTYLKVRVSLC